MAITNLIGTTWFFDGFSVDQLTDWYDISFQSNGNSYIKYEWEADEWGEDLYDIYWVKYYTSENSFIYAYQNGDWTNEAYATITITGGTHATSSSPYFADLLDFLEASATQQTGGNSYTLTQSLTNLSPGDVTFLITPDAGCSLPSSVTVTNGTLVSYDSTTGLVVVNGENAEISVECTAPSSGYTVTITNTFSWVTVFINGDEETSYAALADDDSVTINNVSSIKLMGEYGVHVISVTGSFNPTIEAQGDADGWYTVNSDATLTVAGLD